MDKEKKSIAICNHAGYNPLLCAIAQQHKDTIAILCALKQCLPATILPCGISPFRLAVSKRDLHTTELCLQHKNKPSGKELHTVFVCAAAGGATAAVALLVANCDYHDHTASVALQSAAKGGFYKVVALLLNIKSVAVNGEGVIGDNEGARSPLYLACAGGHRKSVRLLLRDVRCDPKHVNHTLKKCSNQAALCTPLTTALLHGHDRVVLRLLRDERCREAWATNISSLFCAIHFKRGVAVRKLLKIHGKLTVQQANKFNCSKYNQFLQVNGQWNRQCAKCARWRQLTDLTFKKCGRCKCVYYCSTNCQSVHWKQHKVRCIEMVD
jgi:hypothetical protein